MGDGKKCSKIKTANTTVSLCKIMTISHPVTTDGFASTRRQIKTQSGFHGGVAVSSVSAIDIGKLLLYGCNV